MPKSDKRFVRINGELVDLVAREQHARNRFLASANCGARCSEDVADAVKRYDAKMKSRGVSVRVPEKPVSEPDYWTTDDAAEELSNVDFDEAVEYYLDGCEPEEWPKVLEVYGWRRCKIPEGYLKGHVLDHLLEVIDEEFGSFDDHTEPTERMKKAGEEFLAVVLADYPVWRCEQDDAATVLVDVAAWVRKNYHEWMKDDRVVKALARLEST